MDMYQKREMRQEKAKNENKEENKISFYILNIFLLEKCKKNKCAGVMKKQWKGCELCSIKILNILHILIKL